MTCNQFCETMLFVILIASLVSILNSLTRSLIHSFTLCSTHNLDVIFKYNSSYILLASVTSIPFILLFFSSFFFLCSYIAEHHLQRQVYPYKRLYAINFSSLCSGWEHLIICQMQCNWEFQWYITWHPFIVQVVNVLFVCLLRTYVCKSFLQLLERIFWWAGWLVA